MNAIKTISVPNGEIIAPQAAAFPNRVTVELTNACNLSCPLCPRQLMTGKIGLMKFELFRKIVDELSAHPDTVMIPFMRGESMLHKQFVGMLKYARRKGVKHIQYTSNATLMKPDIARALVDCEVELVSFSVDSIDPDTYAAIRPGGNLEKVLANIAYFCQYRDRYGKGKTRVQVSVVNSAYTAHQIDEFVAHWRDKVDRVRVFEQHTGDGNFGSVEAIKGNHQFEHRLPCRKVFDEMSIYWNGQAAICCHDWDRTREIGDVNESTIVELWHNEIYNHIRATHIDCLDEMEKLCRNCDQWKAYYLPQGIGAIGVVYEKTREMELNPV